MATYKQMCETISDVKIMQNKDGAWMTAEEIFNYSAAGELFRVHIWYLMALQMTGDLKDEIKKTAHFDDSLNCYIADQDTYAGDYLYLPASESFGVAGCTAAKGNTVIGLSLAL